jgi:putative heme transporter
MSIKAWVSIITLIFLALVLYISRHEIARAIELMANINGWILLILIPLQFVSYFTAAEMIFSYLRTKRLTKAISPLVLTRLALEMNFVNHVLPSGGVSGISFMGWRLKHFGISISRSTTGQLVRMVTGFASYTVLLVIAVILMSLDGGINRWIVLLSTVLVSVMLLALTIVVYILSHEYRIDKVSNSLVKWLNRAIKGFSFGRSTRVIYAGPINKFLREVQEDYNHIMDNKKILIVPFLWGLVFSICEVAAFYVTFLALGHPINPAPLVIAYGLAGIAGFFVVTPGGAGAYEFVMVGFLTLSGINPEVGIAGIVVTRILLMFGTIAGGYAFYQQAIWQHGKRTSEA